MCVVYNIKIELKMVHMLRSCIVNFAVILYRLWFTISAIVTQDGYHGPLTANAESKDTGNDNRKQCPILLAKES